MTHRLTRGVLVTLAAASSIVAAPASAQIYWANQGSDSIGRANLDGEDAVGSFISGATDPGGVAIDGNFVYWSHEGDAAATGMIGRATHNLADVDQDFIVTDGSPGGIGVDAGAIYWTQTVPMMGERIGRAGLDGNPQSENFVIGGAGPAPCGISSDADEIYWASGPDGGTDPGRIRSSHGQFSPNHNLIPNQPDPCGVARSTDFLYWTLRGSDAIGRADFDGSNVNASFIDLSDGADPCGIAVDETHVYWTSRSAAGDTIGRAPLGPDGNPGTPDEDFIPAGPAVQDPCGIAVTPTTDPVPAAATFAETPLGGLSDLQAVYIADTSSSVLDVSSVDLTGAHPGDFQVTGDACTPGATSAGGGCVINFRFAPTGVGARSAALSVASNASDSPTVIPLSGTGTAPPDSPAPPPSGDSTPPVFFSASVDPERFLVDRMSVRARKGTTFRYALSEQALVTFTIDRRTRGRVVAGECVKETKSNRKRPRCTITKRLGSFDEQSSAGANERRFSGALGNRVLRPGPHRVTMLAVDGAGNVSPPRELSFRVLQPPD